jgi:HAD superfamily hydrolase (TIGR01549 family)
MSKRRPIKALVFDFDGVIAESVNVKTEAFCELFKDYPEHLDEIKKFHLDNGGVSRYEKIRHYYKNILREPLTKGNFRQLCGRFRHLVVDKVVRAPYAPGAKEWLHRCLGRYRMFVVSGTPQREIREIVRRRRLSKYFQGVYGSPKKKAPLVRAILRRNRWRGNEVVVIGDSPQDLGAAKQNGAYFVARVSHSGGPWLRDKGVSKKVRDLRQTSGFLKRLNGR